jgi:hypothetical protein
MCHDWWIRRERRRHDRFDEELRWLLDEDEHAEPAAPIVEHEHDEEPADPERIRVEA